MMLGEMPTLEDFYRLIVAWKEYNGTWYKSEVMDRWLNRVTSTRESLSSFIDSDGKKP